MSEVTIFGAPEGFDALLLARARAERDTQMLHIARDDNRLSRLAEALGVFAPEIELLRLPAWDCLPYDRVSPNPALVGERIATLTALLAAPAPGRPRIVLTTANSIVQRVPARASLAGASLDLARGGRATPEAIAAFLEANGYHRTGTVIDPGEFAIRGGIIDLFATGMAEPVRLDLFGDDIETIHQFDPGTQRRTTALDRVSLRPGAEFRLDDDAVARFRTAWRTLFGAGAAGDPLYLAVSERRRHPGMEHWAPLFAEQMETLFDYLPDCTITEDHQAREAISGRLEMIDDHYQARRGPTRDGEVPYRPLPPDRLYLTADELAARTAPLRLMRFSPFTEPSDGAAAGIDAGGRPGRLFTQTGGAAPAFDQLREQHAIWADQGRRLLVAAWTRGSRERLAHLLAEHGTVLQPVESWAEALALPPRQGGIITLGLERGFLAEGLAVVCEQDLLGERISRPARRRRRADQFIAETTELAEGDLVVHQDHGIGRYDGLETITVGNAPHDCLRLIYDGEGKLFLPVENIEMLSRYGSESAGVALDKLGGASWQARKSRMKQRVRDIAGELIRIAAERHLRTAPAALPPDGGWEEFCARFPFAETEDQSRAIADVLEDLAAGQPMDRLICGDVGFGKTEVALRAAFVVAMAGLQVAVVVPTTLLARQHFRTFTARFAGLPVSVRQLSRMVTAKDAAETRAGLADGRVSIVIGTHALLAKSISFADLGLLIVDEEQHFGVSHKEKLKALKAEVHVLTLTATPIPRTLQLALTGVREMSLIATPPVDRLAVRTFIMPFDSVVIREALLRERLRGGQVFCVVPRIEDLDPMAARLAEIVPGSKLVQAHGRLSPTELERVMTEFGDGRYDILLSTNIVESGLDMPAVNTLIIHRADRFGLGQLYQLRGRVGRGKLRGYAYLTWPQTQTLSVAAEKRLGVMQSLDSLGAGFTLASHDLDIRGAGNLLGDEQSGHIREVGIELYQQMLEDAVAEQRAKKRADRGTAAASERDWTPNINLGLPVLIPEIYVADLPVRLGLYRRIGGLAEPAEIEAIAAELVDRFGPLPGEVENLLRVVELKLLCRRAGVERLEAGPKGLVLQFRGNAFSNPAGLVKWLARGGSAIRLRPDHRLAISREMPLAERLRTARDILAELDRIAAVAQAA